MYLKGFKMLGYIISDKERINVEEHEIQSFDILHKTDLNIYVVENNRILYKNNIIFDACFYGHIQVLEWFKNSGYEFKYDELTIDYASYGGHVQVLEWFKNSGYELKYDKWAINWASKNGHDRVLEWFKNSDYKFKYDENAIYDAFGFEHVKILEFFKNHNVKKVIKCYEPLKFNKTIKFKTKNNYIKGYNKN